MNEKKESNTNNKNRHNETDKINTNNITKYNKIDVQNTNANNEYETQNKAYNAQNFRGNKVNYYANKSYTDNMQGYEYEYVNSSTNMHYNGYNNKLKNVINNSESYTEHTYMQSNGYNNKMQYNKWKNAINNNTSQPYNDIYMQNNGYSSNKQYNKQNSNINNKTSQPYNDTNIQKYGYNNRMQYNKQINSNQKQVYCNNKQYIQNKIVNNEKQMMYCNKNNNDQYSDNEMNTYDASYYYTDKYNAGKYGYPNTNILKQNSVAGNYNNNTYYNTNEQKEYKNNYSNKMIPDNKQYIYDSTAYQSIKQTTYTKYQEQESNFYNESTDKSKYEQYKAYVEKQKLKEEFYKRRNSFYSNIKYNGSNSELTNINDRENDADKNLITNDNETSLIQKDYSDTNISYNTRNTAITNNKENSLKHDIKEQNNSENIEKNNEYVNDTSENIITEVKNFYDCVKDTSKNTIKEQNNKCTIKNIHNADIKQKKTTQYNKCTIKDIQKYEKQYDEMQNIYENIKNETRNADLQSLEKKLKRKIKKIEKYDVLIFPYIVQFVNNKKTKCNIKEYEFASYNTMIDNISIQLSSNTSNTTNTDTTFTNTMPTNNSAINTTLFLDIVNKNTNLKIEENGNIDKNMYNKNYTDYVKEIKPDLVSIKEYVNQQIKISHTNNIKNKAQKIENCDKFIEYEIVDEIVETEEKEWTTNEINTFESIKNNKKDFRMLQQKLKKDIKEIVLHYYRNKKRKTNKRKAGRISDDEMRRIIETNWSEKDINKFVSFVPCFGKDWKMYAEGFPNKQEKDYKLLYRYVNKYRNAETKKQQSNKKSTIAEYCIKNFKTNEKQLFAIYFPFIGKNWNEMAQYINKSANELRMYYKFYYKNMTENERKFETYTKEMNNETLTCPNSPKRSVEDNNICGIIFKHNKK
ncbi:hypothetical protein BDAP_001299 [Binucleata daphniae]